jgi:hypothetical protein
MLLRDDYIKYIRTNNAIGESKCSTFLLLQAIFFNLALEIRRQTEMFSLLNRFSLSFLNTSTDVGKVLCGRVLSSGI